MKKTTHTASVAELKARLSEYLSAVKAGQEITITERSVPIARIAPLARRDLADARTRELLRTGQLRAPDSRLPADFLTRSLPADPDGALLKALLEEREEGW